MREDQREVGDQRVGDGARRRHDVLRNVEEAQRHFGAADHDDRHGDDDADFGRPDTETSRKCRKVRQVDLALSGAPFAELGNRVGTAHDSILIS